MSMPVDAYTRAVREMIDTQLRQGCNQFGELVSNLPGVDPITVKDQLAAMGVTHRILWPRYLHAKSSVLPTPHPLDFDWRFTKKTGLALLAAVSDADSALFLGTPSIFNDLPPSYQRRCYLLDQNPVHQRSSAANRQVLSVDLLHGPLPSLKESDIAIADPPWYPEYMRAFAWCASAFIGTGARLLMSVPPLGVRPEIHAERQDLFSTVRRFQLEVLEVRTGALRYEMPDFEKATFAAAGLEGLVPHDWRTGDLVIFTRREGGIPPRPETAHSSIRWVRRLIANTVIMVDTGQPDSSDDASLLTVVSGDVLPSVSRRDPRRDQVRVWTSDNRVFGCEAPRRLLSIIDAICGGRELQDSRSEAVAAELKAISGAN